MLFRSIEATNQLSLIFDVPVDVFDIGGNTGPALPDDLVEIQRVAERLAGSSDDFLPVRKVDFLPLTEILTNSLDVWAYQQQIVLFIGALTDREVIIEYIGKGFPELVNGNSVITMINSKTSLAYRTSGLAAGMIGENPTRADELNSYASTAAERLINLGIKNSQVIPVRRRPFRSGIRSRGW